MKKQLSAKLPVNSTEDLRNPVTLARAVKPGPTPARLKDAYTSTLGSLARALTAAKTVSEVAPLSDILATAKEDLEALYKVARSKVLTLLEEQGEVNPESGTQTLEAGGWRLEARRQGGFFEAKKVEAALRAKNIDPAKYMQQEVTFSIDEDKLALAVKKKVFTQDELELLKRGTTLAMQRPVRVQEE